MWRTFLTYVAAVAVLVVILSLLAFALYTGCGRYTPPMFAASGAADLGPRAEPAPPAASPEPAAPPSPAEAAPAIPPTLPLAMSNVVAVPPPPPAVPAEANPGPPPAAVAPVFETTDPKAPDADLQLIDLRMKAGEWAPALALCRQILADEPGRIDVRVRQAAIFSLGGNDNEAYREAMTVLDARPDDHRAHLLLAGILMRRGLTAPAVAHARKAAAAAPALPEASSVLGQALLADGAHAEARKVLERLAMIRPDDAELLMSLGSACARGGDTNRATDIFQKVQELQPDSTAPDLALGELNLVAGRRAQAIENYRRVLAKAPTHPVALNNLAALLFEEKGNTEEAMRLASQAWQLYPDSPQVADTLGWMYAYAKDYAKATVLLGFAVRREPRDPTVRYHLAFVLHARGLVEEADQQLTAALESGIPFRDAEAARALRERIRGGEAAAPAAAATNAPAAKPQ